MKRIFKLALTILSVLSLSFLITSCDNKNDVVDDKEVTHVVSFDNLGHGVKPANQTVKDNGLVIEPAPLTEDGYTFGGWYKENTTTNKYDFNSVVTSDFILYAKWTENQAPVDPTPADPTPADPTPVDPAPVNPTPVDPVTYTVVFDSNGGTAVTAQTVNENAKAALPTEPTKEGYTFAGWFNGNDLYDFEQAVAANLSLTAHWEAVLVTYTVTLQNNGHGQALASKTVNQGENLDSLEDLTAEDAKFLGWFKDEALTVEFDANTEITADITLYASWIVYKTTKPTIYLAGDSTVQTYTEQQYIAGWGQYLGLFLNDDVTVVNCARGGRSSRSFINEDRLFTSTDGTKYNFSENGGKSIEECIKPGDYLFVQFGHNDDDTKGYTTMPDRMVPLGTPDSNGIYPVTAPTEKKSTAYFPASYLSQASATEKSNMQNEINKYGSTYYAYGDGTYKWYLKQYIDLARSKGATPVLITPVARVSFNADGTLKSGAGLHGEGFAYVKAVRQLAEEENCLLIDNFNFTKELHETATPTFANFLMAIVPNTLDNGPWPTGYDSAYNNSKAGFEKIEATHYNKYGAYITAAYIAEAIINSKDVIKGKDSKELFTFVNKVLATPEAYITPSNRLAISMVAKLEGILKSVNVTDPNRTYLEASVAIEAINALKAKGELSSINSTNLDTWKKYCSDARAVYESLNYDKRSEVTNLNVLEAYEAKLIEAKPKPTKTIVFNADSFTNVSAPVTVDGTTFSFDAAITNYAKACAAFSYNDVSYNKTKQAVRFAGNAALGSSPVKYIEFTLDGPATVTMVASGGGTADRTILMVDSAKKSVATFTVSPSQSVSTAEIEKGGTYRIGSTGSNIDLYYIIIEYYA